MLKWLASVWRDITLCLNPRWDKAEDLDDAIVEGIGPYLFARGFTHVAHEGFRYENAVSVQFFRRGGLAVSVGLAPRDGWSVMFVRAMPGEFKTALVNQLEEGTTLSFCQLIGDRAEGEAKRSALDLLGRGCHPEPKDVAEFCRQLEGLLDLYAADVMAGNLDAFKSSSGAEENPAPEASA